MTYGFKHPLQLCCRLQAANEVDDSSAFCFKRVIRNSLSMPRLVQGILISFTVHTAFHSPISVRTKVGSKYTFWDQMQIQLGQIKFKYIAFPDFNSNIITNFQFKYKYTVICFIQIRFHYIDRFEI